MCCLTPWLLLLRVGVQDFLAGGGPEVVVSVEEEEVEEGVG